ncbi:MAG: hypothetical protein GC206_13220 [Alphaproteobacteria bacterium]|nr:hypothetical protein [Alphaproteobacteria bacterium]
MTEFLTRAEVKAAAIAAAAALRREADDAAPARKEYAERLAAVARGFEAFADAIECICRR